MKTDEEKQDDYKSIKKELKKIFLIFFGFGLLAFLMINGLDILNK